MNSKTTTTDRRPGDQPGRQPGLQIPCEADLDVSDNMLPCYSVSKLWWKPGAPYVRGNTSQNALMFAGKILIIDEITHWGNR